MNPYLKDEEVLEPEAEVFAPVSAPAPVSEPAPAPATEPSSAPTVAPASETAPMPAPAPISKTEPVEPLDDMAVMDVLVRYKRLLDQGIITEEEFAAKKKQLLGL